LLGEARRGRDESILVAMDGTDFDDDDHATLCVSLMTTHGRATPLGWKTVRKSKLKNKRTHCELEMKRMHECLPSGTNAVWLAGRAFRYQKLYELLSCSAASDWTTPSASARTSWYVTAQDQTRVAGMANGRVRKLLDPEVTVRTRLGVASLDKSLDVFGDRVYTSGRRARGARAGAPFLEQPIRYEMAYGGTDTSHPDPSKHVRLNQNPVGRAIAHDPQRLRGMPADVLEYPGDDAGKARPVAFGPVASDWVHAESTRGTHGERVLRAPTSTSAGTIWCIAIHCTQENRP
jgi:hypothetical protein